MPQLHHTIPDRGGIIQKTIALSRRVAIRERCMNCSGWYRKEVENCTHTDCRLHPYRMRECPTSSAERAKAIREYCLWCCNEQPKEVRLCPAKDCPVWPFRQYQIDRSMHTDAHRTMILEKNTSA